MVIPQAHDQNHSLVQTLAHASQTTFLGEDILIAEGFLLGCAEVRGDRVSGDTANVRGRVGDNLSVLHVDALDLAEGAGVGAVAGDELSNNGHLGLGVDGLARAEEGLVTHTEGVEVTSIGIAGSCVASGGVSSATLVALAHGLFGALARVRSVGSGNAVGFPDIHLRAARSVAANTSVLVALGRHPVVHVGLYHALAILLTSFSNLTGITTHLAVDELQITRALRVTVTSSVLGTCLVAIVLSQATIGIHGDKVQSSIESAGQTGSVHIECELLVLQLEDLVGTIVLHQKQTGANVGSSDKAQSEGIAIGGRTVGAGVVSALQSTVCGASLVIGAESRIPLVSKKSTNVNARLLYSEFLTSFPV